MTGDNLAAELRRRGVGEIDDSTLVRALYSSDASLYRVVPQAVAKPRHIDELAAVQHAARELGVPLTVRGAGTSIAGNAVGPGIVVDTRRLNRVLSVDPDARTAVVETGVVHADLQRAAAPYGLRFGPDPSTHTRCTIGGMIGNNACGSRALGYGRTADNIEALDVVFGTGEQATVDATSGPSSPSHAVLGLSQVAAASLSHIRTTFGRFNRQVSGYSLEHLLPERRRVHRFLVGSEGTLATVLRATVRLVADEPGRRLLVLGYPSMADAADAVPAVLDAAGGRLIACEGLDVRLVAPIQAAGRAVPELPRGKGWLFAEATGPDAADVLAKVAAASAAVGHRLVADEREATALWRIREDGAGLAARSLPLPAHAGWEDAAVPPDQLGAWLRDFETLLSEHGLHGAPYGHFGDGCVHVRIDFPFREGDTGSASVFREFLTACAERLRQYGGSLSGEHGDGRARSELLPLMYDAEAIVLFGAVKAVCDPDNLLNPGNIVDPAPLDADLRPVRPRAHVATAMRLVHDDGSLETAVHRCTGVGKCVAPHPVGVMCPSFAATLDEKDSTRGRSRVLQEALDGSLIGGLAHPAVAEALDLCLSCKGCLSDCPTGVDMATYKSEVLYRRHRTKRRPRSHYALGRLPRWARAIAPVAGVANVLMRWKPVAAIAKKVAGVDQRRALPRFARRTLRRAAGASASGRQGWPDVWIWADSFTDHFFPESGLAAIRYFESCGLTARVIPDDACCGLTWITTGQLDEARAIIARTVRTLEPYVASGTPVVGVEPSCLATLRSDATELDGSAHAAAVAEGTLTFAEAVAQLDVPLPDLSGVSIVAQPHCHQASVLGWSTDEALLLKAGATVTKVAGCCGLAGNFGVEEGHYDVSVAVAETNLLPAVRSEPGAVVLADGMSCRVQLDDLAQTRAMHLAELFDAHGQGEEHKQN